MNPQKTNMAYWRRLSSLSAEKSLILLRGSTKSVDMSEKGFASSVMTFITNSFTWSAYTICELYRARWGIEVFFKELKQTLQLADFMKFNENAVRWQIWTARWSSNRKFA